MFKNESLVRQFEDSFSNPIDEIPQFINNLINYGWTIYQIYTAYNEFADIYCLHDTFQEYSDAVLKEFQSHGLVIETENVQ